VDAATWRTRHLLLMVGLAAHVPALDAVLQLAAEFPHLAAAEIITTPTGIGIQVSSGPAFEALRAALDVPLSEVRATVRPFATWMVVATTWRGLRLELGAYWETSPTPPAPPPRPRRSDLSF
jgi:hypothetical protein